MRRRLPAFILAGFLLVLAGWIFWSRAREPKYEGRPVNYWFREYCRSTENGNGYLRRDSVVALQNMGTNAVPYLLEQSFSTRQDSAATTNLHRFINGLPHSWGLPWLLDSQAIREDAPLALKEMKPPAGQLLPLLEKHLKSTTHLERRQALFILGTAGDGAALEVPYLVTALNETNDWDQMLAIQSLGWIGSQAGSAVPALIQLLKEPGITNHSQIDREVAVALGEIGNGSAPAALLVRRVFEQETNWMAKCNLASALFRIDPSQTETLDFLTDGLMNHQPASEQWVAAFLLGEIGPGAKAAVPILLRTLAGTNDGLFSVVPQALKKIGVASTVFLPAMKKQLEAKDETDRANAAIRVLYIDPADHEAHLVLMKIINEGGSFQILAIDALGNAGPAALEVIPVMREAAKEGPPGNQKREAAARALKRIEAKAQVN